MPVRSLLLFTVLKASESVSVCHALINLKLQSKFTNVETSMINNKASQLQDPALYLKL